MSDAANDKKTAPDGECLGWAASSRRKCGKNISKARLKTRCLTCGTHTEFEKILQKCYDVSAHTREKHRAFFEKHYPELFELPASKIYVDLTASAIQPLRVELIMAPPSNGGSNPGGNPPAGGGGNDCVVNERESKKAPPANLKDVAQVASVIGAVLLALTGVSNWFVYDRFGFNYFEYADAEDHASRTFEMAPWIIAGAIAAIFAFLLYKLGILLWLSVQFASIWLAAALRRGLQRLRRWMLKIAASAFPSWRRCLVKFFRCGAVGLGLSGNVKSLRQKISEFTFLDDVYYRALRPTSNFYLLLGASVAIAIGAAVKTARIADKSPYYYVAEELDPQIAYRPIARLHEVTFLDFPSPERPVVPAVVNPPKNSNDASWWKRVTQWVGAALLTLQSEVEKSGNRTQIVVPNAAIKQVRSQPPTESPKTTSADISILQVDLGGRDSEGPADINVFFKLLALLPGGRERFPAPTAVQSLNFFYFIDDVPVAVPKNLILLPLFPLDVRGERITDAREAFKYARTGTTAEPAVDTVAEAYAFGFRYLSDLKYETAGYGDQKNQLPFLASIVDALGKCGDRANPIEISVAGYASEAGFAGDDSDAKNHALAEGRRARILNSLGFALPPSPPGDLRQVAATSIVNNSGYIVNNSGNLKLVNASGIPAQSLPYAVLLPSGLDPSVDRLLSQITWLGAALASTKVAAASRPADFGFHFSDSAAMESARNRSLSESIAGLAAQNSDLQAIFARSAAIEIHSATCRE